MPRRMQDQYSHISLDSHLLPTVIGYFAAVAADSDLLVRRRATIRAGALMIAAEMLHHGLPISVIQRAVRRRTTAAADVDPEAVSAFQDTTWILRASMRRLRRTDHE